VLENVQGVESVTLSLDREMLVSTELRQMIIMLSLVLAAATSFVKGSIIVVFNRQGAISVEGRETSFL
jgi:hypothetical protein